MDAHPRELAERPGGLAPGSGAFGSRRENALELVRPGDFELVVTAIARLLVRPPVQEDPRVPEAIALHVVVLHLAHTLDAQRFPGKVLARAPAALRARHAAGFGGGAGPIAPGMGVHRILAQRLQLLHELLAHRHRER